MKSNFSIFSSLRLMSLLVAVTMLTNSCMRNPVTGKRELSLLSESQEQAMGDEYDPQVVAQYGVYNDNTIQKFIDEHGQRMAKISHRAHLTYDFKILDSPVVNAFAVPGGYVYFTRGIMAHFSNEAEFAGVLGHEIGHITARHSAKQYSKQMAAQVLLIGGMIASEKFRQYGNLAMQGAGLLFLKFSRDAESESDKLGVEYSTAIGYDAHEMANFFNTISRLSAASGQSIPDFLSTHPNPDNRFVKVNQMADDIQKNLNKASLKVERDPYLRMIDGLIYGEDPRQGFVENSVFYHPELLFQFNVPTGWQYQNSPAQFQMAPESGKALIQLSLGQGASASAAKSAFIQNYKLTEVSAQNTTVNGFPALKVVADQVPDQQQSNGQAAPTIRILGYFIEYGGKVYQLLGMAEMADYAAHETYFNSTATSFKKLTDSNKINRQPERVRIRTINKGMTLQQALASFNMPTNRLEELAILNGMELTDQLPSGTLVKTIGK